MSYLFLIILLALFFLYFMAPDIRGKIEHFEDKFDPHESPDSEMDAEFVDLYEIIYRDFMDVNYDVDIVRKNAPITTDSTIAVMGCGVGKLCKRLKDVTKNVIGVDWSEMMLKKAQKDTPHIKYIRGNLCKEKILPADTYSHIFIDERTLYYNNEDGMKRIIENCFTWLKKDAYLIVPIYNPERLQLACRYYTSKYMDDKGNIHGFTYLNNFNHDCYYIRDEKDKEHFDYYDKIVFDTGERRIKKTRFTIPAKEKLYDMLLDAHFSIVHVEPVRIQLVGGYELVIFQKKEKVTTVDSIETANL